MASSSVTISEWRSLHASTLGPDVVGAHSNAFVAIVSTLTSTVVCSNDATHRPSSRRVWLRLLTMSKSRIGCKTHRMSQSSSRKAQP